MSELLLSDDLITSPEWYRYDSVATASVVSGDLALEICSSSRVVEAARQLAVTLLASEPIGMFLSGASIETLCKTTRPVSTTESSRPSWWDSAERRFAAVRALEQNWNGYGALPLDAQAVNQATALLASLVDQDSPEPSIVPAARGGVQLEWHTLAADLEIEVVPGGIVSVLFTDAQTGEELEPEHPTNSQLREFVQRTR